METLRTLDPLHAPTCRSKLPSPCFERFSELLGLNLFIPIPAARAASPAALQENKNMQNKHSIEVGKYLVSPMIKPQSDGSFAASVSIRSGQGMASHDRVMRFTPSFHSQRAAIRYARAEGLAWIQAH